MADPRTDEVRYVGMTFRQRQRFNEHLSKARKGGKTHRDCWIRSLLAAGVHPVVTVVQEGADDGWQEAERSWIAHYRPMGRLVNHTDGGEGTPGCIPSAETRRRWSEMRRGVTYAPGRVPGLKGKTHQPEVREKIREAGTGRRHSDASKAKLSAAHAGKVLSREHREKLSKAHRGKVLSSEHKAKIAESTSGRKAVVCAETGESWLSITDASRSLGVTEASVNQAIRKGCRCRGNRLQFA